MKRLLFLCCLQLFYTLPMSAQAQSKEDTTQYIQIALLLDVSGSMEGLLSQAQGYLWSMMDYLENFQYQDVPTEVELAIISYGHSLHEEKGHMQVLSNFTQNFDTLSNQLFLLQVGGGNEYCGQALKLALDELAWKEGDHFRAIFIAGNEIFTQGSISFEDACQQAKTEQTIINTIFCGMEEQAEELRWHEAAEKGGGDFTHINQEENPDKFKTPYDNKILQLYNDYVATLIDTNKILQLPAREIWQDISPVFRDQVIYKYQNHSMLPDVVQQFYNNDWQMTDYIWEALPAEWKEKSERDVQRQLFKLSQRRRVARQSLDIYIQKTKEFLDISVGPQDKGRTLDQAMQEIIEKQLSSKGFKPISNKG